MSTTLDFAGTTRCEIRAAEVSQLSRGAAWLLVTLDQGTNEKGKIWVGIVCAPAACEFLTDFPNRVNMWKIVTMLWVLENTVVNRCFDQACLVSCSVIKPPVVRSSNGDITFIVNKHTTMEFRIRTSCRVYVAGGLLDNPRQKANNALVI